MARQSPERKAPAGRKPAGREPVVREPAGREAQRPSLGGWTRAGFEPSALDRKIVEMMVAHGVPQAEIATVIENPATGRPVSLRTLNTRFRKEITEGHRRADSEVEASLYRQAVGRVKVIVDGEVIEEERLPVTSASIWWTKARMGWKAGGEAGEDGAGGESGQDGRRRGASGRGAGRGEPGGPGQRGERRNGSGTEPVGRVVIYLPDNGREPRGGRDT